MKKKGDKVKVLAEHYTLVSEPTTEELIWITFLELKGQHAYKQLKKWGVSIPCLKGFDKHLKKYFNEEAISLYD